MSLPFVLRVLFCWVCVDASRLHTQAQGGVEAVAQVKFGPSCDTLQSRFRMRSKELQNFSNSYSGADDMTLAARARAVMKASAVLRPLRRGSDCPWAVAGNNNDDIEAIGKVVRSILSENPCAPAAIAELQLLDTPGEQGGAPLARAISILMSDTCEYEDQGQESNESDEIADIDDIEIEELVQDGVEEMLESEDKTSSLVEQQATQRTRSVAYVAKMIGAIMLGVLFSLGCGVAGFYIGSLVGGLFGLLLIETWTWLGRYQTSRVGNGFWTLAFSMAFGAGSVSVGGAALCGSQFHRVVSNLQ